MAYVQIDIDLDEFNTSEIVEELQSRLRKFGRKGLTVIQKEVLKTYLSGLIDDLELFPFNLPNTTPEDRMKIEHLAKVWNNYTSYQIEKLLP